MFRWRYAIFLWVFVFLFEPQAFAKTNRFSVAKTPPALGRDGLFTTVGSQPLLENEFTFSSSFDYAFRPLQLNDGDSRFQGVVDHLVVQQLGIAFAPLDWLQVDVQMPIALFNSYINPDNANDKDNKTELGDLTVRGHFRLLPRSTYGVGVSLIPSLTIPTGNENYFVADKSFHGGMIVSTDVDISKRFYAAFNFGFSINEEVNFVDYVRDDSLFISAGATFHATDEFDVMAEVTSSTELASPYADKDQANLEVNGGLKYTFKKTGISASAGAGVSLIKSVGSPSYRVFAGISYTGNFFGGKQARAGQGKVKERDLMDQKQASQDVPVEAALESVEAPQPIFMDEPLPPIAAATAY